jgi:outer membrane receptor protein involved in Fe transport
LSQVGVGISVVTGEQLDTLAANGLEDYLQLLPGVSFQSLGGPGVGILSIRGVSPQSVGATVATYIDDIPFGGSSSLAEGGDFAPDLDPADIQRVEVLKGPQGTLYGASSLGGVIKWVTRQPNLETTDVSLSQEANYTDGGEPGGKVRASYSTPLVDDVLAVRMSSYYRWIGGYIDDVGLRGKDANNGDDWGLHGTLLYKPTTDLTISLNALTQQSRVNSYNTVDLNPATGQPLYGDLKHLRYTPEGITDRTNLISSAITWETTYGSLLSATSYSEIKPADTTDETLNFAPFPFGVTPAAPAARIGHHSDQQETEELRFTSKRLGSFEFLGGGFFQHELLRDGSSYQSFDTNGQANPTGPFFGYNARQGTLDEKAGFFNATYYILPQLDASVGFRHSDLNETSSSCVAGLLFTGGKSVNCTSPTKSSEGPDTYSAGIRWRLTDGAMLYARAASGYRPGGQRGIPPGAPAGFSTVYTSDSIWSYEAGTKIRALDGRLTVDVDGFWIDWTNIQALVFVGRFDTDGNGGTARSRGVEFQSTFVPFDGLTLSANATQTNAIFTQTAPVIKVTAGERLYYVPSFTANVGADYSIPVGGGWSGNIGGNYSYTGRELDATNHSLPSYSIANLHMGATHDKYNVSVYVKNAANKRAIIGDLGYFGPTSPVYTVTVNQPLTVGVVFSEHF